MRTALNALREIISSDETQVREDARAAALNSVERLEQLWGHLQRNYHWEYRHCWPAMCERALLEHLAVVADWADALPQPVPLYQREPLRDLMQVAELVSYFATGKIKTGEEKIYGLEIWNTRPVAFSTAPGLKAKADGLFDTADGDYGWHIQPVDKKGRKVGYIFLFDSTLSEDELIWEPLHFTAEDLEDLVTEATEAAAADAEAAEDSEASKASKDSKKLSKKDKKAAKKAKEKAEKAEKEARKKAEKEAKERRDKYGHDPLRDTLKDKRGKKVLAAAQEAVSGAVQTGETFDEWSGSFRSTSAASRLAFSAKASRPEAPIEAAAVADHLAAHLAAEESAQSADEPAETSSPEAP